MLLKTLFTSLPILFLAGTATLAQPTQPRLFHRYEAGASYHRISENVLTLRINVAPADRDKIAIRFCSKQPLLFALATARVDAFRMAELLVGAYSYSPQEVIYLRSEGCLAKDPSTTAIEIWTLREDSLLPHHVEARFSSQVRRSSLGKRPVNYGVRDYEAATRDLIARLQANPGSRGVVIGYFFKRPSAAIKRRLRRVKALLQRSGLPPDRYHIQMTYWNDEYSMSDPEPPYPRVFLIEEGEFIDGGSTR